MSTVFLLDIDNTLPDQDAVKARRQGADENRYLHETHLLEAATYRFSAAAAYALAPTERAALRRDRIAAVVGRVVLWRHRW